MFETSYQQHGYATRRDYLRALAKDYGVSIHDVLVVATLYGPSEDFDALVTFVQDMSSLQREMSGPTRYTR